MEKEYTPEEKQRILNSFMRDGVLVKMPAQRKKQLVIIEEFAKLFESNRKYTEKEVNAILEPLYADFITLRRDLIDVRLLARDHGIYWKVDTEPPRAL